MGRKKRPYTIVNNGYFNIFESEGKETPEIYKEADEYLKIYYGRGNSLGLNLSSISLLENGFWLNELCDDLINDDGVCVIPDGINYIRANCSSNNKKIHKLIFPSSLLEIGEYAFEKSYNLSEIEFSYGLERIGAYAFCYSSVSNLIFPGSIKTLDRTVYSPLSKLNNIKLNYGTELCFVPFPSNLHEVWITPTLREIRCDDSFIGGDENYNKLKRVYIFKGDTRWKTVFKHPETVHAEIIEVEDGWGEWREHSLNNLDKKINDCYKKIKKYESRLSKDNSIIIPITENIEILYKKIKILEEEKRKYEINT